MKQIIQFEITEAIGRAIASREGDPKAAVARFIEQFQPDTAFVSPKQRVVFIVCDVNATELTDAVRRLLGEEPTILPVIDANEFATLTAAGTCAI